MFFFFFFFSIATYSAHNLNSFPFQKILRVRIIEDGGMYDGARTLNWPSDTAPPNLKLPRLSLRQNRGNSKNNSSTYNCIIFHFQDINADFCIFYHFFTTFLRTFLNFSTFQSLLSSQSAIFIIKSETNIVVHISECSIKIPVKQYSCHVCMFITFLSHYFSVLKKIDAFVKRMSLDFLEGSSIIKSNFDQT